MKKSKEINYRKLTRNNVWVGLVALFAAVCIHVVLLLATSILLTYIVESKIQSEIDSIQGMVAIYENSVVPKEELYALLDKKGREYFITDGEGKVLHSKGQIEAFDSSNSIRWQSFNDNVTYYSNSNIGFIKSGVGDGMVINLLDIFKEVREKSADVDFNLRSDEPVVTMPVWQDTLLSDGETHFYAKASVVITVKDALIWFVSYLVVTVLIAIVILLLVIAAIVNHIRNRRTLAVLFGDPVTGGKNMNWFVYYGNRIIRKKKNRDRKYAVVSIELVKYNLYCVCHSMSAGEELLKKINDCLTKNILKKELCARVSSAEFVLLLKYTDEARIQKRVSHIISQLEALSEEHKFGFQAGITVVDPTKTGEVLKNGHIRMDIKKEFNYAKAAAGALSVTDESGVALLDDKMIEEQRWIDTVCEKQQSALDNEEFVVFYQPKYDPRTDKLTGAEALIRWQSPEFGLVPPGRIIPIFEQNGFITQIDHYMIRHVARDQKKWLDEGKSCVPVSVNVSRAHFAEDDLADQICALVDEEKTPHELIEIELTESAFFDDKKAMLAAIAKLKNYGFAVSMDDFGSGYSSLNSLKDMPLDVLKLDAEFFRGDGGDGRAQIVVSEAIRLAKNLNMRTVAEGVEVKEQVDFLAKEGCDMIQGYYYAKPMPADEFVTRI
ncbi:MAG: EAL domain-containing protein [Lachnospiraceae bacterium]|nr:EAL domain-containing protein [Lachnospiraceae bacterium]